MPTRNGPHASRLLVARIVALAAVLAPLGAAAAWSQASDAQLEKAIVGTWDAGDGTCKLATNRFDADHTFRNRDLKTGKDAHGTYAIKGGKLYMKWSIDAAPEPGVPIAIEHDRLIVSEFDKDEIAPRCAEGK
jgi:hypothetical protein